jgi:hypothetical protein
MLVLWVLELTPENGMESSLWRQFLVSAPSERVKGKEEEKTNLSTTPSDWINLLQNKSIYSIIRWIKNSSDWINLSKTVSIIYIHACIRHGEPP